MSLSREQKNLTTRLCELHPFRQLQLLGPFIVFRNETTAVFATTASVGFTSKMSESFAQQCCVSRRIHAFSPSYHQLTFLINKRDEVYGTEHSYSSWLPRTCSNTRIQLNATTPTWQFLMSISLAFQVHYCKD